MQRCEYYIKESERKVHNQKIPLLTIPPIIFPEYYWCSNPDSPLKRDVKGEH